MMAKFEVQPGAGGALGKLILLFCVAALAACSAPKPHRAPVEDRSAVKPAPPPVAPPAVEASETPAAEAARLTQYTVRPGDTLIRIALELGVGWRDLARWNGLDNPNLIEVGQVLRVAPPGVTDPMTRPVQTARAETRPLDSRPPESRPTDARTAPAPAAAPSPVSTAPVSSVAAASAPPPAAAPADGELNWAWPASGNLIAGFDEQRNKGIAISGKAGEPVLAAADGRVMYAGSGLRGYGNMVIIKHNDTFLSAYAHNQSLLVKEDQVVRRGQPIAEMGSSDADRVKLHFEIRRKGKPVDPARLLPPR